MALLEACLAKPYRWLAILHSRLVHVGKCARVDGIKLVALLLAIPVFEAQYLLFQLLYAAQQRRLRIAGFHELEPRFHDRIQKLRGFLPNFGRGAERLNALRNVHRRLEAAERAANRSDIHTAPLTVRRG